MKFDIDWSIIPTLKINGTDLTMPYDICTILKEHNIDWYVYQITYKGVVLKYGMSADNSKNYGERLYRQISHAESWGEKRNGGSSGADWRIIEDDFFKEYGIKIDIKDVTIRVWDVTNYPFQSTVPWDEVNYIEQSLIKTYIDIVGEKPIGNVNDESNITRRARPRRDLVDKFFTF
jgi:hypothetical protein